MMIGDRVILDNEPGTVDAFGDEPGGPVVDVLLDDGRLHWLYWISVPRRLLPLPREYDSKLCPDVFAG
jgi:hypothetical protein